MNVFPDKSGLPGLFIITKSPILSVIAGTAGLAFGLLLFKRRYLNGYGISNLNRNAETAVKETVR